jgi:hypothetical protein
VRKNFSYVPDDAITGFGASPTSDEAITSP